MFYGYSPGTLEGMELRVLPYDDSTINAMDDATLQAYIDDKDNYGSYFWKDTGNPSSSWAVPFVTGHKYKIHW